MLFNLCSNDSQFRKSLYFILHIGIIRFQHE